MAYALVLCLKCFFPTEHVLNNMSPRTLITGKNINFDLHCKHEFGGYVQTHEKKDNTIRERTIGALELRPTGNVQGGVFYL